MSNTDQTSRRSFLRSAGASVAGAVAMPAIVPSHVLGKNAPSNTINIGHIGCGWRAEQLMHDSVNNEGVRVAALADVDRRFLMYMQDVLDRENGITRERVKGHRPVPIPEGGVDSYHDYRRLLDRDDIDAVVIAVPDHWHAKTYIDSMDAGKDVYGEKPLSLTINQGRAMVQAARANNRVFQTGSQQRSQGRFRNACELVYNGYLGKIDWVQASIGAVGQVKAVPDEPVPPGLDWDFWLGPAPYVPYNPLRCHIEFRWFFEYSGGLVTDWGAHHIDIAQWGLGYSLSGPRKITGKTRTKRGAYNVFNKFEFTLTYDNGVELYVNGKGDNGITFHGEKGEIFVSRSELKSDPVDLIEQELGPGDTRLYKSDNHYQNWVDCVKSREKPICDVEIGHRSATACHLCNISGRLKRDLEWDPVSETFIGDAEANAMRDREERPQYSYKS